MHWFLEARRFLSFAKGFWCKHPLGKRKSYLSYSQKSSDRHFLGGHLGCLFLFDRNLFWVLKNSKKKDSWGFFFPAFSGGFFHRNVVLEGVSGIPVFCRFHRNFLQEFLRDRNFCIYKGFLRIPPDSSGFLFPPNAVWLWPAIKVGFLLSKYQIK